MPENPWRVTVRNASLVEVAGVGAYRSLKFTAVLNAVGTWSITVPAESEAGVLFTAAYASGVLERWGVVIRRPGTSGVVFSGFATDFYLTQGGDAGLRSVVTVVGQSDEVELTDLVYPSNAAAQDISSSALSTQSVDYSTLSGPAETILLSLVSANIGPSALTTRRRKSFLSIPTTSSRGSTVNIKARFDPMLDVLDQICERGGIAYRVVQGNPGTLNLSIYVPTVRDDARFVVGSSLDRVEIVGRSRRLSEVIVAGSGIGTARQFTRRGSTVSGSTLGRRAAFVDQRQTADLAELQQAGDEELARAAAVAGFRLYPSSTEFLVFGRDYNLGDRVTVALADGSVTVTDVVRQVSVEHDPARSAYRGRVVPTVGRLDPDDAPELNTQVRSLTRRLNAVERRL